MSLFEVGSVAATETGTGTEAGGEGGGPSAALAGLASRVPRDVYFGTSSWSFPGWKGIVYSQARSESQLAREGLREYAQHPLLRTVGIDRGYYAPIPERDLRRYSEQLPPGFPCCTKAPEAITSPIVMAHRGARGGEPNPDFLSFERFQDTMLGPFARAFRGNAGPFILEFPPVPAANRVAPDAFAERLDAFLERLPRDFTYVVELRDRRLLTRAYQRVIARHRVGHTYNYWTAMPLPAAQLAIVPIDTGPCAVVRLLLRPGTKYVDRKDDFAPFDKLMAPDAAMRQDVLQLILSSLGSKIPIYILVNNKAEGSAPLTIRALAELLVDRAPSVS